jgi:hypothetical protein
MFFFSFIHLFRAPLWRGARGGRWCWSLDRCEDDGFVVFLEVCIQEMLVSSGIGGDRGFGSSGTVTRPVLLHERIPFRVSVRIHNPA